MAAKTFNEEVQKGIAAIKANAGKRVYLIPSGAIISKELAAYAAGESLTVDEKIDVPGSGLRTATPDPSRS